MVIRKPVTRPAIWLPFVAALWSLAGCATVAHGRHQEIVVTTTPDGAEIFLHGARVGTTPAHIPVRRKDTGAVLTLQKPGYAPAEVALTRHVSGWIAGNVALGAPQLANQGLSSAAKAMLVAAIMSMVPVGVDVMTGAAYKLTPPRVDVQLHPTESAGARRQ